MSKIEVAYLRHMGDDLDVVNAARVSFSKASQWETKCKLNGSYGAYSYLGLSDKDTRLIRYLVNHNHFMPFTHCTITFHVKAPIFVARQLMKHRVGLSWWDSEDSEDLSWSEVSRRYVDDTPEFFEPEVWRARAPNVKQGSSEDSIGTNEDDAFASYAMITHDSKLTYEGLLQNNVAPEQARMVLPQSTMTEWIWTGSLFAFIRVVKQRMDSHAQREASEVAQPISDTIKRLFPVTWDAFFNQSPIKG
jgi:thymidylate synthase (FAD)